MGTSGAPWPDLKQGCIFTHCLYYDDLSRRISLLLLGDVRLHSSDHAWLGGGHVMQGSCGLWV